jgi:hypothetical protein
MPMVATQDREQVARELDEAARLIRNEAERVQCLGYWHLATNVRAQADTLSDQARVLRADASVPVPAHAKVWIP